MIDGKDVVGFPPRLQYLQLWYDHEIYYKHYPSLKQLPSTLKTLILQSEYNEPLDYLPNGLEHLFLGDMFNQEIDNKLPDSLLTLDLGGSFNRNVDHLPPHLTGLRLTGDFNQSIDHLPNSITKLLLRDAMVQPIHHFPSELRWLEADFENSNNIFIDDIICTLFPNTLTYLDLMGLFGTDWNASDIESLPNLKTLILGDDFNSPLSRLSNCLEYLELSRQFDYPLAHLSLFSIQTIYIRNYGYNLDYARDLLETHTELMMEESFTDGRFQIIKRP